MEAALGRRLLFGFASFAPFLFTVLERIPGALDRLQVGIAHVGVSDGGTNGGVTKQLLNVANIGTVFQ
jgi:hypothetical protein